MRIISNSMPRPNTRSSFFPAEGTQGKVQAAVKQQGISVRAAGHQGGGRAASSSATQNTSPPATGSPSSPPASSSSSPPTPSPTSPPPATRGQARQSHSCRVKRNSKSPELSPSENATRLAAGKPPALRVDIGWGVVVALWGWLDGSGWAASWLRRAAETWPESRGLRLEGLGGAQAGHRPGMGGAWAEHGWGMGRGLTGHRRGGGAVGVRGIFKPVGARPLPWFGRHHQRDELLGAACTGTGPAIGGEAIGAAPPAPTRQSHASPALRAAPDGAKG